MLVRILESSVMVLAAVFLVASLAGFVLDRPVLVSYVYSESMSPTLNKGDVFFINPLSKGSAGDIIVFKMNGQWTVHRVYAETSSGFITKGDNNVATDQQSGRNNAVSGEDVIGTVVTLGDQPIKVPVVGEYIGKISNVYLAFVALIIGAALLTRNAPRSNRKGKRRTVRVKFKTFYAIMSAIVIAVIVLSTMIAWGSVSFSYASTQAGGQNEGWYLPNSEFDEKITIRNRAVYPFVYIIEPDGDRVSVEDDLFLVSGGEKREIVAHVKVPDDTHIYTENLNVYAYPPLLPVGFVKSLYDVSPYAPLLTFAAELTLFFALLYRIFGYGDEDIVRFKVKRRSII